MVRYRRTRNTVVRTDAQRKKYYEHYTGQVWGVGGQYDLLLEAAQTMGSFMAQVM